VSERLGCRSDRRRSGDRRGGVESYRPRPVWLDGCRSRLPLRRVERLSTRARRSAEPERRGVGSRAPRRGRAHRPPTRRCTRQDGVPTWSLKNQSRADARRSNGVRRHAQNSMTPPMGFGSLSAKTTQAIVDVLVCLTNTVRSQGFSPSQRIDPAWALRLCFTPLPPQGLHSLQSVDPLDQPYRLSAAVALMPFGQRGSPPKWKPLPLPRQLPSRAPLQTGPSSSSSSHSVETPQASSRSRAMRDRRPRTSGSRSPGERYARRAG
jgi:hypothetical protein